MGRCITTYIPVFFTICVRAPIQKVYIRIMKSQGMTKAEDLLTIEKTVRLEDQALPSRFEVVKLSFHYRSTNRTLCFDSALRLLCKQGFPLEGCQIFFWDCVRRIFVFVGCFPNQTELAVPYEYFQDSIIHIRYRKVNKQADRVVERHERQHVSKRVKERSIQEAMDKVDLWVKIYEQTSSDGKRLFTLETAAKEVGVAKKTLDDYKTQLKLGEKHRFDFNRHRLSKIGVLRNFVKTAGVNAKQSPLSMQVQAEAAIKMEAQASNCSSDDQGQGYLFHETHSCYGSDSGSNRD